MCGVRGFEKPLPSLLKVRGFVPMAAGRAFRQDVGNCVMEPRAPRVWPLKVGHRLDEVAGLRHSDIMHRQSIRLGFLVIACFALVGCAAGPITRTNAANSSGSQIGSEARGALDDLYRTSPAARHLGDRAVAVLVFPRITKGGFVVGGMGGNGALIHSDGSIGGYYQTAGLSYGLEAGLQRYSYAVFFMNRRALSYLDSSEGWEIGSSPNVVVIDQGMGANLSSTTMQENTYAYFFNQRGLMAGISLQGTKITRIAPGR